VILENSVEELPGVSRLRLQLPKLVKTNLFHR